MSTFKFVAYHQLSELPEAAVSWRGSALFPKGAFCNLLFQCKNCFNTTYVTLSSVGSWLYIRLFFFSERGAALLHVQEKLKLLHVSCMYDTIKMHILIMIRQLP